MSNANIAARGFIVKPPSDDPQTFALWQPAYAEHDIATFPLRADKRPAIKGFMKIGLRGSTQLAFKFATTTALGFLCGERNKISVGDVDTIDERVLADFLDRHGATPIIVRTASGKYHAWYRCNGERRRIRPWPDRAVDILGRGGFVVAPPSKIERGHYHFIQGSLDDLDRLPIMRNLDAHLYVKTPPPRQNKHENIDSPLRGMREHDGRNAALFKAIAPVAREIHAAGGTKDALTNVAMSHNKECGQAMTAEEVSNVVGSMWKMTVEGRNHIGQRGAFMQDHEVNNFRGDADAFYLLAFLRAREAPTSSFWIANGLAEQFGWTRQRLAGARCHLLEGDFVKLVKPPWRGHPATYAWPSADGRK